MQIDKEDLPLRPTFRKSVLPTTTDQESNTGRRLVPSLTDYKKKLRLPGGPTKTESGRDSDTSSLLIRGSHISEKSSRLSINTFGPARFSKKLSNRNSLFTWKPEFTTILIARRNSIGDPSELIKHELFKSRRSIAEEGEFTMAWESNEEMILKRRNTHQQGRYRGESARPAGVTAAEDLSRIKAEFKSKYGL